MTLVVHPGPETFAEAPPQDEWRSFSLDDLLGVAGFLAGNVLAHRAEPESCAHELLDWTDGRPEALAAAARSIEGDADQQHTLRLLRLAVALAAATAGSAA